MNKRHEFKKEPAAPSAPWWEAKWTRFAFPVIPGPRCSCCGSTAGVKDGCCAVCTCPIPERQIHMAPLRGLQFPVRSNG